MQPLRHNRYPLKMKKVVYLVSHGHTARGLIQTGLIEKLVKCNLELHVFAIDTGNDQLKHKVTNAGAEVHFFKPMHGRSTFFSEWFRIYMLEDIKSNPALWEKHLRRVDKSQTPYLRRWIARFFLLLSYLSNALPFLKKLYLSVERSGNYDEDVLNKLKSLKPDLIVSTRPVDRWEGVVLGTARKLRLKRLLNILSWDNITCKGYFREEGDYYLSWGPIMTHEIEAFYKVSRANIRETGVAHFDLHFQSREVGKERVWLEKLGLNPDFPYIFFCMSAPYFCPDEIDIIEWLAKRVQEKHYGEQMQFIARPHMQNIQGRTADITWIGRLKGIVGERVAVDFPDMEDSEMTWHMKHDDMEKMSALLVHSTIAMNSCSTVAIESVIADRPTVMPMFDVHSGYPEWKSVVRMGEFTHMKKFINLGGVEIARSFDELDEFLRINLREPDRLKEKRLFSAEQECYKIDGKSTQRVSEAIAHFASLG